VDDAEYVLFGSFVDACVVAFADAGRKGGREQLPGFLGAPGCRYDDFIWYQALGGHIPGHFRRLALASPCQGAFMVGNAIWPVGFGMAQQHESAHIGYFLALGGGCRSHSNGLPFNSLPLAASVSEAEGVLIAC